MIREVLLFGDAAEDPVEHEKEKVIKVLDKMSYEGSYLPTTKKLLHPYWRLLAHVYLVCISGNKRNTFKFPRLLQIILEAKYSQLQPTVSIYDTKIMNHMVFSMLNQKRQDVQVTYQNRKPLAKFGAFYEIIGQVQAPVNVVVADEHDVQIIDAPPDRTNTESLTADKPSEDQPLSVNLPRIEPVESVSAEPENVSEDPTTDLHPRKRNRRDPRISLEIVNETRSNPEPTMPVVSERPLVHVSGTPMSEAIIDFLLNPRAVMYVPGPKRGERSSSTPSNADVLKASELLQ
ncbi:hypothetical protein Hanom_Chr04g00336641 [Helianthus anomalus]